MAPLPSAMERQQRFQRLFLKKVTHECARLQGQRLFPAPPHKLAGTITQGDIATIRSTQTAPLGLSLIYFQSRTGPLLLTTTGIFFKPKEGENGHVTWSHLDAVAMQSLTYDDTTLNVEKDAELLAKSSSKLTPLIPTGIIVIVMLFIVGHLTATMYFLIKLIVLPILILIIIGITPYIYGIFFFYIRTNIKKTYFQKHPDH